MEFVVEPVVSELFKGLFKILESTEVRDFARNLVGGVDSELKELKKKLLMVENLLRNAEDKQVTDKSVKEWLDNLQHWAYDAEDLLDEFAYEASRRKLKAKHQDSSSKGMSFLPASSPSPLFSVQMGSKIKDITRRLEQLRKERSDERVWQDQLPGVTSTNIAAPQTHKGTSSVPPEKEVYGRVEDEAKLLDMVKSAQPSDANFRVIAIVGMGGIGKTTMARAMYNHKESEGFKFEEKAWVCVSNNFHVLSISKSLLGSLKGPSFSLPSDLNGVQVELQKAVDGKIFLIVLDDVWEVDYREWEQLMASFKKGAPGSTMIVTTRSEDVAKTIRCSHIHRLKLLSEEACWALLMEDALATGTAADAHLITDSIRKRVLERCSGLPLAAKALGGLLYSKPINTWGRILDSEIWNSFEKNVLPVLKLSYFYLPSQLKRCFSYCAVFPKDYEFEEKELVLLWMAEGTQVDVAGQYFNDLCLRSFFQKSSNDSSKYIMHDLIHDLAESVFEEFSFRSEKAIIELPENIKKIRHFSYISNKGYHGENDFKGMERFKSLRTFLPVFPNSYSDYYDKGMERLKRLFMKPYNDYYYSNNSITAMVLFYLLAKLKKLRILSLERYNITHLPDSIGDLIHLRYLNFSYTRIKSLPESISQLFNLQTLLLKDCRSLMKLPCNMRYLTNLYHLDISGQNMLEEMPSIMKELKNLRVLSNFIVGKEPNSNLEDLKSLNFLQGELHISKLENVTDRKQIGEQILSNKNNLKVLLLEWEYMFLDSRKEDVEMHVLDKLKPPSSLVEFTIKCYGGQSFPSNWFKDPPSVSNLVVLKLDYCRKCKFLPSLEMLSSLKDLTIKGMTSLKRIDFQMPLKSLEVLRFMYLEEWEHWDTWRGNEDVERLAKLRELHIEKCPKLTGEFPDHLPSLERFVIRYSSKLVVSVSSLPEECKVEIDWSNNGVVCNDGSINFARLNSSFPSDIPEVESKLKQGYQKVECLQIDDNDEIMDSWQNLLDIGSSSIQGGMHGLTFLKKLEIRNCKNDFVFFENTNFLPNLTDLTLGKCQTLISLPGGLKQKNLERLRIDKCDSLRSIDFSLLPSSLKKLEIHYCWELEFLKDLSTSLLEYLDIVQGTSLTCTSLRQLPETLQALHISYCYRLKTLPRCQYLPKALTSISIQGCTELKSIDGSFEKSTCLQKISLVDCENLESIPLGLQNLSRVDSLEIKGCPKLVVREGVSTSLIKLYFVGGLQFDKPMIEWELHNLTTLSIKEWLRIESIPNLTSLTSLTQFTIQKCPMLESIHNLTSLTSLTELSIVECPIKSIPNLTSLTSLTQFFIDRCPMLESILNLTSLTSLRFLLIIECQRLKSIPALGSLEKLEIRECPRLKSVQSLPSSLLSLKVSDCPLLKKQWKRGKKRYCSKIAHIPYVSIDEKFIFNSKEE